MLVSQIRSSVEYSLHHNTAASNRKTVNVITDGLLIYWVYYNAVLSKTGGRDTPVSQSGSTNGTANSIEVYLEILALKVIGILFLLFLRLLIKKKVMIYVTVM